MSDDRRRIAIALAKAAKLLPVAERQLFREFLKSLPGAEERPRKIHSWKKKAKPPAKRARPKQFAFSAKKSREPDLFD
jgi:hypothetical protein